MNPLIRSLVPHCLALVLFGSAASFLPGTTAIAAPPSVPTIVASITPASPSNFGQPLILPSVAVTSPSGPAPTGNVSVFETTSGTDVPVGALSNVPAASISNANLGLKPVGTYSFRIDYLGDANYAPTSLPLTQVVAPAVVTVTIPLSISGSSPSGTANAGANVTLRITVSAASGGIPPLGSVQARDNTTNTVLGNGIENIALQTPTSRTYEVNVPAAQLTGTGTHNLTASYTSGTANFANATSANFVLNIVAPSFFGNESLGYTGTWKRYSNATLTSEIGTGTVFQSDLNVYLSTNSDLAGSPPGSNGTLLQTMTYVTNAGTNGPTSGNYRGNIVGVYPTDTTASNQVSYEALTDTWFATTTGSTTGGTNSLFSPVTGPGNTTPLYGTLASAVGEWREFTFSLTAKSSSPGVQGPPGVFKIDQVNTTSATGTFHGVFVNSGDGTAFVVDLTINRINAARNFPGNNTSGGAAAAGFFGPLDGFAGELRNVSLLADTFFVNTLPQTFDVLANDRTVLTGSLTITGVTQPTTGGVVSIVGGMIRYTPPTFAGVLPTGSFTYTVSNGSASQTVTVTLTTIQPGTYLGLLQRADNTVRGRVVATAFPTGVVSAAIRYEGRNYAVKGSIANQNFNPAGPAPQPRPLKVTVGERDALGQLTLVFTLPDSVPGQSLTGTLERAPYEGINPAPQAGRYTMLASLPVGGSGPARSAALACSITANGTVTFNGKLGNGVAVTQGGRLLNTGRLPFYFSKVTGALQSLGGELAFDRTVNPAVTGTLRWTGTAAATPRVPGGVNQDYEVFGLPYVSAGSAVTMFNPTVTNATLTVNAPSLGAASPYVRAMALGTGIIGRGIHKVVLPAPGLGGVTFSTTTGFFTGSGGSTRTNKRDFFGVVLQGGGVNQGRGIVLDTNALTTMQIVPVAPVVP